MALLYILLYSAHIYRLRWDHLKMTESIMMFCQTDLTSLFSSLSSFCTQVPRSAVQNNGLFVIQWEGAGFYCFSYKEGLNNRREMTVLCRGASFFMQEYPYWNAWRYPWFWWKTNGTLILGSPCFRDKKWGCFCLLSLPQPPAFTGFLWTPTDYIVRLALFKQMSVW